MKITATERKKLISKYMKTPEGRVQIAAAMNQPLREYQDYEAVGRRAFTVDSLLDGDLPYYDKDVNVTAFVIGEEGESVTEVAKGDRVFVPLFEVASLVEIPLTQLKQRRYDVESRVKQKTRAEVFRTEDNKIFKLFKATVDDTNSPNTLGTATAGEVAFNDISDAMGEVEKHGSNRVANIFINGRNQTVFRKVLKDLFEPVTVGEIIKTGFIGVFGGAQVHVSPEVQEDYIYFTADKEFLGVISESQKLTILSADNPAKRAIGFSIFEQIGCYVQSSGISALKLV